MVSLTKWAIHEKSVAVGTDGGQLFMIHFLPALFTIPSTHAVNREGRLKGSSLKDSDCDKDSHSEENDS